MQYRGDDRPSMPPIIIPLLQEYLLKIYRSIYAKTQYPCAFYGRIRLSETYWPRLHGNTTISLRLSR